MSEMRVLGDRILVEAINQQEHVHASGLISLEAYAPSVLGTVVWAPANGDVRIDDVVIFPPSAGQEMHHDGKSLLVLQADDILAVYDESGAN